MRVFDEDDVEIPEDEVDLSLGYLESDYIEGEHYFAIPEVLEEGHMVYTIELENGKIVTFDNEIPEEYAKYPSTGTYVVDVSHQDASDERVSYEPIYRYIRYSEAVTKHIDDRKIKSNIENLVEQSTALSNSVSDISNNVDNVLLNLDDLLLAMADLIGGETEVEEEGIE